MVSLLKEPFPPNLKKGLKPTLELDSVVLKVLFATVDKITIEIQNQIVKHEANNKKFDCIFLVGGFAESHILRDTVTQQFKTLIPSIVVPGEPIHAVISGGILLGRNPDLIRYLFVMLCC